MKYLKLATILMLATAMLAMTTLGAGIRKKASLQSSVKMTNVRVNRTTDAVTKKAAFNDGVYSPAITTEDLQVVKSQARQRLPLAQPANPGQQTMALGAGTYRIGATGDYASLSDAFGVLNLVGISGPVTFLLDGNSFSATGLALGHVAGASSSNTITIQPAAGRTNVVITVTDDPVVGGGLVFQGTNWLTINGTAVGEAAGSHNLTIKHNTGQAMPATTVEAAIRLRDGVRNFAIKNTKIAGLLSTTTGTAAVAITGSSSVLPNDPDLGSVNNNTDITFDNCWFGNARYGIYDLGLTPAAVADTAKIDKRITIKNSSFGLAFGGNITQNAIRLQNSGYCAIDNNVIRNLTYPSTYAIGAYPLAGIQVLGWKNVINANRIDSIVCAKTAATVANQETWAIGIRILGGAAYGVLESTTDATVIMWGATQTNNTLSNNVITGIYSAAAPVFGSRSRMFREHGMDFMGTRYDTVFHNSISMNDQNAATASGVCLMTEGSELATSRTVCINNIFSSTGNNSSNYQAAVWSWDMAGADYRAPGDHNLFNCADGDVWNVSPFLLQAEATVTDVNARYGTDAFSTDGDPYFVDANTDLTIQTSAVSQAADLGEAAPSVPFDFAGTARSATSPDAGAYEFALPNTSGMTHDIKVGGLSSPGSAPVGFVVNSMVASVKNNTRFTETNINVHMVVKDPSAATVYDKTQVVATLGWNEGVDVEFTDPWTPTVAGNYEVTISTDFADADAGNNTIVSTLPVAGESSLPYSTGFESPAENLGWAGTGDFALGSVAGGATKLGGAHAGDGVWMTVPGPAGTVYTAAQVNYLYTPFFDFTTTSNAVLSFWHALDLEQQWDRSSMEYSVDTGKTWHTLGALNEPYGINWYAQAVYTEAGNYSTDTFDEVTAQSLGYPADNPGVSPPHWAIDLSGNPAGYVQVSIDLASITGPKAIIGKHWVRFRYVMFSDASTTFDGVAFDDFAITASGSITPPLASTVSGTLYTDANGNGANDAEAAISGAKVYVTFAGVTYDSATTDGSGAYSLPLNKGIGAYTLSTNVAGLAATQSPAAVSYDGLGGAVTGKDFGYYAGSISGKVVNDANDNGTDDSEAGLSGWSVEVHANTVSGALKATATTDVNGAFSANVGPGTYALKVVNKTGFRASTGTVDSLHATVSGNSGDGTANVTGKDFFRFQLGSLRLLFTTDLNGDGLFNETVVKLGNGVFGVFKVKKGPNIVKLDSVGNATSSEVIMNNLDFGTYSVVMLRGPQAGYTRTAGQDTVSYSITHGGQADTLKYLYYKNPNASGKVVVDANGNGTIDGGETSGLSGWTVNLSGTGATSTTTDGSGNFSFTAIAPGAHTLTVTAPAGYQTTVGGAGITFTQNSGVNATNKQFAAFQQFSISGSAYRDRDFNGAKNGSDDALAGVVVSLTKDGNPAGSASTDGSGNYSFSDLGPGAYVVSAAAPSGYAQTEPASNGTYSVTAASGVNSTGNAFGFFHLGDSLLYRTITVADLIANGVVKPAKNAKADTVANIGNLVNDQIASISVGVVGTSKATAWFQPKKYSDVFKSVGADGKSPAHSGTPGGFDFTAKGKVMGGRYSALPSTTQDNVLFANLLALNINLAASDAGAMPAGLGSLIVNDGGPFNGMTVNAFADSANYVMSYWKRIPQSTYDAMNSLAAGINNAFNSAFDYDAPSFRSTGKVTMAGVKSVYQSSILLPATSVAPKMHRYAPVEEVVPTVYALYQNYPNPFNPTTNIRFDLPMSSVVTVKIYNMLGQEVATLYDHESMDAGVVEAQFNAASLSSGVYFYRVSAEGQNADGISTGETFSKVMKMALVK